MTSALTIEYDEDFAARECPALVENEAPQRFKVEYLEGGMATDSPLTTLSTKDKDKATNALTAAAELIEASIFGDSPEQVEELEQRALDLLSQSRTEALFVLAIDGTLAADIRGVAARMFAEHTDWNGVHRDARQLATALVSSSEALVRLGFVLGLEDGENQDLLARLCHDPHPRVRQEAEQLRASGAY